MQYVCDLGREKLNTVLPAQIKLQPEKIQNTNPW